MIAGAGFFDKLRAWRRLQALFDETEGKKKRTRHSRVLFFIYLNC